MAQAGRCAGVVWLVVLWWRGCDGAEEVGGLERVGQRAEEVAAVTDPLAGAVEAWPHPGPERRWR